MCSAEIGAKSTELALGPGWWYGKLTSTFGARAIEDFLDTT